MKHKKIILIIYIALLNITIISLVVFNTNLKGDVKLVDKKEEIVSSENIFAIMVENEDKTGYVESENNIWPSNMGLNEKLTYCKDENGEILSNPLTFKNGVLTVRTNKKIYCHLYFFDLIPDFTYSGTYEIVDDNDNAITTSTFGDDWKIRFLTSGTLTFTNLADAQDGIDVFLVGGGGRGGNGSSASGGGGGGGYTTTEKNIEVTTDANGYYIKIGGSQASTTGFGFTANPGGNGGNAQNQNAWNANGGAGSGSGGQGAGWDGSYYENGRNGGDGAYEFGEVTSKKRYGGGGGSGGASTSYGYGYGGSGGAGGGGHGQGSNRNSATSGSTNTGGGGGGGGNYGSGAAGGSGIVIIRNART